MNHPKIFVVSVVVAVMLCIPAATSFAIETTEGGKRICVTPGHVSTYVQSAMEGTVGGAGEVRLSSSVEDEEHPALTKSPDGSFIAAFDRQISQLRGHIYFLRSTDNGGTWSDMWDTDTGDMANSIQNWPVLCTPPGGDAVIGSWNDILLETIYYVNISDPADPGTYQLYGYDASGWDYDRHTFTIHAYDQNRFAVGHVGHIEFSGYDLPSSCQISWFDQGFAGQSGITGDEDYPLGYNNEIAVTSSLYWLLWDFPNESTGTSDLLLKWGDPGEETDAHLWPDREITSDADYLDPALGASGDNLCMVFMSDDNVYGDFDLACKYSTDEGDTWQDGTFPSQSQVDEKSPELFVSGSTVFCTFIRDGNLYLTKSTDLGQTWEEPEQINGEDGTVVEDPGAVDVTQAGIVWTDIRNGNKDIYYVPLPTPIINVESITGGFGVSATITNTGSIEATDIPVTIELSGLVFVGGTTETTIDTLAPEDTTTVSTGLVLGIGPTTISVEAGGATSSASGFVLGPLVLGL